MKIIIQIHSLTQVKFECYLSVGRNHIFDSVLESTRPINSSFVWSWFNKKEHFMKIIIQIYSLTRVKFECYVSQDVFFLLNPVCDFNTPANFCLEQFLFVLGEVHNHDPSFGFDPRYGSNIPYFFSPTHV